MPDIKISALTAAAAATGAELLPVVQSGVTKQATLKAIAAFGYQDIVTDATTTRTLSVTDLAAWVRFTSASAVTMTVPPNSSVAFIVGTTMNGIQAGAGQLSIAAGAGVTINKPTGYNAKTRGAGSAWCLVKVATDTWDLIGDLEATV